MANKTAEKKKKLKDFDNRLRALMCSIYDQTSAPSEMLDRMKPLLNYVSKKSSSSPSKSKIESSFTYKFKLSLVFIFAILLLFWWQKITITRISCALGRLALIQILPLFDWTVLYGNADSLNFCLLKNPFLVSEDIARQSESDCKLCLDFQLPEFIHVSEEDSTQLMLKGQPFVIEDYQMSWQLDAKELNKIFHQDPFLKHVKTCFMQTDQSVGANNASVIIQKIESLKRGTSWYAFLRYCDEETMKFFRGFFIRPYFIPIMAKSSPPVSIFLSSYYASGDKHKLVVDSLSAWIHQLSGSGIVELHPKEECTKCDFIDVKFSSGLSMMVSNILYDVYYTPNSGEEKNVLYMAGLDFEA